MSIFKCKMCGGTIEFEPGATVGVCDSCGTKQTLPRLDTDRKANLYDRANHFRRNNDFDKAMGIYEQILNEDNTDSEAYWSLVLCRYGIEYVEDPASHKRIPTVNRAQYTSIYMDEDYKSALQYADVYQRQVYEEEAKTIDDIQKGILEISNKEEPFDVFICYKETDNNGRRTQDSVLANDLYHQLTQEGFKVFFSRITLEDKLGTAYEPYIFAALNSAKVMVVLGTKPEYFNAVWVKNEWSRYLALVKQSNGKKILIPAYRDMDPYDLPEEFSHLQAQDMSKLGFMQDLIRGIKKIIGTEQPQVVRQEVVAAAPTYGSNVDALLKRGQMALEDKEWEKADDFYEEVLNQNAECAEAFIGKLLAQKHFSNEAELFRHYENRYLEPQYEKLEACPEDTEHIQSIANQFAIHIYFDKADIKNLYNFDRTFDSKLSSRENQKGKQLTELSGERLLVRAMQYATGKEESRLEERREKLLQALDARIEEARQEDAINSYRIKESYQRFLVDTDQKVRELNKKASEKREEDYQNLLKRFSDASAEQEYKQLEKEFLQMHGYKDSESFEEKCRQEINRIKQEELEEQKRKELAIQKEKQRKVKRNKIMAGIAAAVVAIVIGIFLYYKNVIIPKQNFKKLQSASVGETVVFGSYEQDNNTANGKEEVEWIVLAKENGKLLLISKYALDCQPYNSTKADVTWETSSVRAWLNESFFNDAFKAADQKHISSSRVTADPNPEYTIDPGKDTTDQVFLLSIDEVNSYYKSNETRVCMATVYAKAKGVSTIGAGGCWWWLRSPGNLSDSAAFVNDDGSVRCPGAYVSSTSGSVRPALWIDLEP